MKNTNQDIRYHQNGSDAERNSQQSFQTGKFALPVCPYCGKRLNPFIAWSYKTKGEYRCRKCGNYSNVLSDGWAPAFGVIAVAISVLMLILFLFVFGGMSFLGIFFMVLPFILFFLSSPFLVRLKKVPNTSAQTERRPEPRRSAAPPPRSRTQPPSRPGTAAGYGQRPPQSRPPQSRSPQPRPTQSRPPQARPPQPSARPGTRPSPTQQRGPASNTRPPAARPNPNPKPRPPQQRTDIPPRRSPVDNLGQTRVINTNPKLFDTMEFGKRAPKDFSDYQD